MKVRAPDAATLTLLLDREGWWRTPGRWERGAEGWTAWPDPSAPAWLARAVPMVQEPVPDPLGAVLFEVADPDWPVLAGELVRLGCTELHLLRTPSSTFLRAVGASFFTVSGHADHGRAFRQPAPGFWAPVGWTHPVFTRVAAPRDGSLLLRREGAWSVLPNEGWTDVLAHAVLDLPGELRSLTALPDPPPLHIPLRLRSAPRRTIPTAWLVPRGQVHAERLLATLPETDLQRLTFAALPDGRFLFAVRPGHTPVVLDLPGTALCPHPLLRQVWLPVGTMLEPALSRARLADLLEPGPGQLAWLAPNPHGAFTVERLPEAGLAPLVDLAVFIAESAADVLTPWMAGAMLDPGDWTVVSPVPATLHDTEADRPSGLSRLRRPRRVRLPPAPTPDSAPAPTSAPPPAAAIALPTHTSDLERALDALAATARQSPDSVPWHLLAEGFGRLGQQRDADLCWARARWHDQPLDAWTPGSLPDALPDDPDEPTIRTVAAAVLLGTLDRPPGPWLERHAARLDPWTRWLVARALCGDRDPLGLARARDAILSDLHDGLALYRDVPAFLRVSAPPAEVRQRSEHLTAISAAWKTDSGSGQLVGNATKTYIRLMVTWGQAQLGHGRAARRLSWLWSRDPLHTLVAKLFRARVLQALDGQPPDAPVPTVSADIAGLSRGLRFKFDRLLETSTILSGGRRVDAFANFQRRATPDSDWARLDLAARVAFLDGRLAEWEDEDDADEWLDDVPAWVDALTLLGEEAVPLAERLVDIVADLPASDRAPVLLDVVGVAAALRRPDLATRATETYGTALSALARHDPELLTPHLARLPRRLLRLDLRDRGLDLLDGVSVDRIAHDDRSLAVAIRLGACRSQLGAPLDTRAIDRALDHLDGALPDGERLVLIEALASAVAPLPVSEALPRLGRLARHQPRLSDSFSTNSHFGISALRAAEAIVLAHVHEDALLSPDGRARLERDEHLLRQRIHQESPW